MILIPHTIENKATLAFEEISEERFSKLPTVELLMDIAVERDSRRIDLWLDMFKIDGNLLDFSNLTDIEKRNIVAAIIELSKSIGTETSIIKLSKVLGASDAIIKHNFNLFYDNKSRYDRCFMYNRGREYSQFSIDIIVAGVADQVSYERKLRGVLHSLLPCRIHLESIVFT